MLFMWKCTLTVAWAPSLPPEPWNPIRLHQTDNGDGDPVDVGLRVQRAKERPEIGWVVRSGGVGGEYVSWGLVTSVLVEVRRGGSSRLSLSYQIPPAGIESIVSDVAGDQANSRWHEKWAREAKPYGVEHVQLGTRESRGPLLIKDGRKEWEASWGFTDARIVSDVD
jgi:hypothetical protein